MRPSNVWVPVWPDHTPRCPFHAIDVLSGETAYVYRERRITITTVAGQERYEKVHAHEELRKIIVVHRTTAISDVHAEPL